MNEDKKIKAEKVFGKIKKRENFAKINNKDDVLIYLKFSEISLIKDLLRYAIINQKEVKK